MTLKTICINCTKTGRRIFNFKLVNFLLVSDDLITKENIVKKMVENLKKNSKIKI